MIEQISIRNFKCFQRLHLPLRPLTVLTGANGAGKSTIIQAILLARQASEDDRTNVVQLNGPYALEIGEAEDALSADAEDQSIEVSLTVTGRDNDFVFTAPLEERSLHLTIASRPDDISGCLTAPGLAFSYLTAERLGPRDLLSVTSAEVATVGVGERGQYVAQALATHERDTVAEELRHPNATAIHTLRAQVEAWLTDIVRPIRIETHWLPGVNASMVRFQTPSLAAQPLRPGNVGFGVSYILPIIVAGLATGEGILIVENPEAHLHPAAQSKLGRFLARIAGHKTQVIIETHSDHIVNGIRRGAVDDHNIAPSAVAFHYFAENSEPTILDLSPKGGISSWPPGFFDQLDEDLGRLARAKRASNDGGPDSSRRE